MTVDSKSTGSLVVDAATGMLKKITTDEDATTNMDMGGQSMATTNKTKLTTVIE